jgi:hypothetical protein
MSSSSTSLLVVFENFDEFNIDCPNITFNSQVVKLYAKKKLNFENGIHLGKIINHFNTSSHADPLIVIQNIKGFNVNTERKTLTRSNRMDYVVFLNDLYFDFYINDSFITPEMCSTRNFIEKKFSFFGALKNIEFNDDIYYRKDTCPFVFTNSQLEELGLSKIANTLIFKNQLEFLDLNETKGFEMNLKKLRYLGLGVYNEDISLRMINKFIFKHTRFLDIIGSINKIEAHLFCSFKEIELVSLNLDDLKSFFLNGIDWIKCLNGDKRRMVFVRMTENVSPFKQREYDFPTEDLCLFKEFPHRQHVFPVIRNRLRIPCSCTVLWLIKNFDLLYKSPQFNFLYGNDDKLSMKYCSQESSTQCNFTEKFKHCGNISDLQQRSALGAYHDFLQFEWLKYVINVYFQTIFSIFGFIFNLLIILVLTTSSRQTKANFKNSMYKHIYFNAAFNALLCLIKSLSLINICIFPRTSFCSSIYKLESSQYFRIFVGLFLGNSLKLCCNISYILFALSRFSVSTSSHAVVLKRLNDMNVRKCYALVVFTCVCFSSFKLFEYKPNEIYAYFDKNFPYNIFDVKYCQNSDSIITQYFAFKCSFFPILNLINIIFNNVLFVIICVLVDVFLVRYTNKTLINKLAILRHRNPKKLGFWMWFWIFKSKIKIKPKNPKNQKTTSKTKP